MNVEEHVLKNDSSWSCPLTHTTDDWVSISSVLKGQRKLVSGDLAKTTPEDQQNPKADEGTQRRMWAEVAPLCPGSLVLFWLFSFFLRFLQVKMTHFGNA